MLFSHHLPDIRPERKGQMLKIRETKLPQRTLFTLTGQFDHQSTAGLEALIMGAHDLGCKHIMLNFSGVTGIDSIALGRLFLWYHKMQPHKVELTIVKPRPLIREILEQSHISDIIPISSSKLEVIEPNETFQYKARCIYMVFPWKKHLRMIHVEGIY